MPSAAVADLVVLARRPAAVHADEVFLARQLQLDRRARLLGQHRGDEIGVLVLVLVAEVAAHVLADDADLLVRHAEIAGDVVPAVGDAAGRRVDRQLVALPTRHAGARLHLGVVHEGGGIAIFEDLRRRLQRLVDVAAFLADRLRFVAVVEREVAFRPDLRRAGLERLLHVEDERQQLVVDHDEGERFFGDVPVDRRHRGHRLADEPHRVVEGVAGAAS